MEKKNSFWYHDFKHERKVEFSGYEVIKHVKFSDNSYVQHLEECYKKLDRSKFKSKIIDFDYKIDKNTVTYTMPLIDPKKFIGSDKNNNVNSDCIKIDHVVQAYYDFIEPCDKGYPIHYDCAMKNYFIVDNGIMFIDVDALVINPEKETLTMLFLLRCFQRIERNNLAISFNELYKELNSPLIKKANCWKPIFQIPYHKPSSYKKLSRYTKSIMDIMYA